MITRPYTDDNDIINMFDKCRSITDVIVSMGIYDNTKNRNKLKLIKDKYKLEFKKYPDGVMGA